MTRLAAVVFAAFALVFANLGGRPALADPTFPPLTGRVVDDAHVLSPETQADISAKLAALEAKNGDQLVVVTLPSLQGYEIEDYGYQLGRAWGIGQKGKDNGALFIVAPAEHKVRIEVGYGLEPVLTDAITSVILQRTVLPHFRSGDIEGGVREGTDAIVAQLGLPPDEAAAQARAAAQQAEAVRPVQHRHGGLPGILVVIFVILVLSAVLRGRGGLWMLPFLFMGGGGGGFRNDDNGGGGFGGGGGSFGGGGSSGSW